MRPVSAVWSAMQQAGLRLYLDRYDKEHRSVLACAIAMVGGDKSNTLHQIIAYNGATL